MIAIFLLSIVTLTIAVYAAYPADRTFILTGTLLALLAFSVLIVYINEAIPYEGGGDDIEYFIVSDVHVKSVTGLLDFGTFNASHEQPGYAWLLAVLSHYAGHELVYLKMLNLLFFILTATVWYLIGTSLETKRLGRNIFVTTLMLTPLWHYFCFLRKDVVIVFLQSLFLLGVVYSFRRRGMSPWLLMAAATIAVIPFRTAAVLINAAILVGATMSKSIASRRSRTRLFSLLSAGLFAAGLLAVAANPEVLQLFGVTGEHRAVGSDEMLETAKQLREESGTNRALFPLSYLLSETTGLSPKGWERYDAYWLRGVLALPWIFLVIPFFVIGMMWLTRPSGPAPCVAGLFGRMRASRLLASPWGALVAFIGAYVAVAWQLGDTTRWRLPDMPVIAAIATAGWHYSSLETRSLILFVLLPAEGGAFAAFYLLRG